MTDYRSNDGFIFGVVKGIGEGDPYKYFGSTLNYSQFFTETINRGLIRLAPRIGHEDPRLDDPEDYLLTEKGESLYSALTEIGPGRAYTWSFIYPIPFSNAVAILTSLT